MAKGDRKRALRGRAGRMQGGRGSGRASSGQVRLWGRHAVEAALMNPERRHHKLWATREGVASLDGELPEGFHRRICRGTRPRPSGFRATHRIRGWFSNALHLKICTWAMC